MGGDDSSSPAVFVRDLGMFQEAGCGNLNRQKTELINVARASGPSEGDMDYKLPSPT